MRDHCYSVYIIASKSRAIYIGMTNNLRRRVFEHKNGLVEGFTQQYRCHRLVYYESFDDVAKAIDREKQLKRWSRVKKMWLIERRNPPGKTSPLNGLPVTCISQKSRSLHSSVDCFAAQLTRSG